MPKSVPLPNPKPAAPKKTGYDNDYIKEVLDSMPVLKANVLHWHMLDDPAWPMASDAFPAFTAPGSGGPYAAVATYSAQQQADIAAH